MTGPERGVADSARGVATDAAARSRADRAAAPRPGRYGPYGGRYVPETLVPALDELAAAFDRLWQDAGFRIELNGLLASFVGRPTPLMRAARLGDIIGADVWLKREDLAHTGSHKINNALGQALLARALGKRRVIAETGAGQHGVATATAAALLGLACEVYMGAEDMERQHLNVVRMELLGARVIPVTAGTRTLKDATSEAIRDWMAAYRETHYLIGSVVGPHPYPAIVRALQRVIGDEARRQLLEATGRLPDRVVACVGGGSNALGIFTAFLTDEQVELIGVEAGGTGSELGRHAASLSLGRPGVLHGSLSYLLQNDDGQIATTHSIAAGLDYPAAGPEHAQLRDTGRVRYVTASDTEALRAYRLLARSEGIIPALESSHAIAYALRAQGTAGKGTVLINLSGRGDKDVSRDLPGAG